MKKLPVDKGGIFYATNILSLRDSPITDII